MYYFGFSYAMGYREWLGLIFCIGRGLQVEALKFGSIIISKQRLWQQIVWSSDQMN